MIDAFAGGVLIISPEAWDAHSVSKHHYAKTLAARGSTVFFLNPPDDFLTELQIDVASDFAGVHVVSGPKVAAGLRFYPAFLRRWMEARWLSHFEAVIGRKINVVWLFENSRFFDLRFATDRLKIYHQVDLNQDFHQAAAAATSDICFCTTDLIRRQLLQHTSKVYKIHHGLAINSTGVEPIKQHQEAFSSNKVHAVYIGNFEMSYLDVDLLSGLARRFNEVQFHFVGGYQESGRLRVLTADCGNIIWWGKVDSTRIPSFLEFADVLLVTYQAAHFDDQASPHKFMEYLASGKVIVATYTDEYKDKPHLLEMARSSADYYIAFQKVIGNLDRYNSLDRQIERKEFALAHTYDIQLDKIIALLI